MTVNCPINGECPPDCKGYELGIAEGIRQAIGVLYSHLTDTSEFEETTNERSDMSRAYQIGHSQGWRYANFADAYEDVIRYSPAPEVTDYRGFSADRDKWDFEHGFSDGWDRFMQEDYPE